MDPELIQQLMDATGMGERDAALKAQELQAKGLRGLSYMDRKPRTPGAALGGSIAGVLQGVGANRLDESATQGRAALDEQRAGIMRALPASPDPAQAYTLARSLGGTGDARLAEYGKGYIDEDKNRVLKLALEEKKTERERELGRHWIPVPALGVEVDARTGDHRPLPIDRREPPKPPGGGGLRAGQHKMLDVGGVPVDHVFDGSQWAPTTIKPAVPSDPAKPATAPVKPLTEAETKEFETLQDADNSLTQLQSQFKDEFAGKGFTGGVQRALFGALGSTASPANQDFANFWADFDALYQLGARHKFFGSAFTKTEEKAWDLAQKARAQSDPKVVRAAFAAMQSVVRERLKKRSASAKASHKSPGAVDAIAPSGAAPSSADDDLINKYLKK